MPSWRDRLRYAFDNFMARGTIALIAGLFFVSAIGILAISLVITMMGLSGEGMSLPDLIWASLMRTLDAGTMGADRGSAGFLVGMLAVTLGGIFVISALIGVINTGLEGKLDELRKGRSRVVEKNHTVVLGWSQQVFTVLAELVAANSNLPHRTTVVVLADRDKVAMDDEIRARFPDTGRTSVVCRSGKPMDIDDLEIARLETSRSILVLSPEVDDPDAEVIKTLLAITNHPRRRPEPYHIVAELRDPANLDIARLVGREEVQLILGGDVISRIVAQTCRQSGLSIVYSELLDFDGDEIYFASVPGLVGRTFGEALAAFEGSALIGLQAAGSVPRLNPPMDTLIAVGDEVIVISADDDTIRLGAAADVDETAMLSPALKPAAPERTLVLGWNWRAPTIIRELDGYVPAGSLAMIVADRPGPAAVLDALRPSLVNQSLTFRQANTTSRSVLEALDVASFDNVIVLCYSDDLEPQQADSKTLFTLLHLRDMQERSGQDFSIVSEMLDLRNRALAEVTHADDFIVSSRLVSLLMAQVAENPRLNAVFGDLFDPDGSEIYLRPASDYVEPGTEVFATIVESGRRRGEVAIGYRVVSSRGQGVRVNPPKSTRVALAATDMVIVLAA